MLKVRYSKLRLSMSLEVFAARCAKWRPTDPFSRLRVLRSGPREVILGYDGLRYVTVTELNSQGEPVRKPVPSFEQHTFRVFEARGQTFMSVLNPGRGAKAVDVLLESVMGKDQYFSEPLELSISLIDRHVARFSAATLVSAKVRDFKVTDSVVGRLEVTSKTGLPGHIAPFLEGKFYRIDSLTYEVTHELVRGLVWYSSNGTVKMSGPIAEIGFPLFENEL